jgi:hypothetical protein
MTRANLKEVWRILHDAGLWTSTEIRKMNPADMKFLYAMIRDKPPSWYCDAAQPLKELIETNWDVPLGELRG